MQEMTMLEVDQVGGGVTPGQVLNVGAGVLAVGGAVLTLVGITASAPVLITAGAVYAVVSAGMWSAGALHDIGYFSSGYGGTAGKPAHALH
jgi:hypothetical protein